MKPCLVFSHANSYPAGTYRRLFEHWRAAGWRVEALDRFGHNPRYPVTSDWRRLRDELIDFIDFEVHPETPVTLVGHSLGGMLSLLAACRRPDLVSQLVMLDSPVIGGWRAALVGVTKLTGLMQRYSPARISRDRRHEWPDRAAVLAHFQAKKSFAAWDQQVLRDYVDCGFEEVGGKTRLRFRREVESQIYATLPHHLPLLLRKHPPRCPMAFIAATRSNELRQAGVGASRALVGEQLHWFDGTHLFPMERPVEAAQKVLDVLASLQPANA